MKDIDRCNAEIDEARTTHHDFAYKITIWQLDWEAEREMIRKEQGESTSAS